MMNTGGAAENANSNSFNVHLVDHGHVEMKHDFENVDANGGQGEQDAKTSTTTATAPVASAAPASSSSASSSSSGTSTAIELSVVGFTVLAGFAIVGLCSSVTSVRRMFFRGEEESTAGVPYTSM